jgi:hypothetical protein
VQLFHRLNINFSLQNKCRLEGDSSERENNFRKKKKRKKKRKKKKAPFAGATVSHLPSGRELEGEQTLKSAPHSPVHRIRLRVKRKRKKKKKKGKKKRKKKRAKNRAVSPP